MKWSLSLSQVLGDKEWGHSNSFNTTAFNKSTGYPGPLFDFYNHVSAPATVMIARLLTYIVKDYPVGVQHGARFSRGIMSWAAASESHAMVEGMS